MTLDVKTLDELEAEARDAIDFDERATATQRAFSTEIGNASIPATELLELITTARERDELEALLYERPASPKCDKDPNCWECRVRRALNGIKDGAEWQTEQPTCGDTCGGIDGCDGSCIAEREAVAPTNGGTPE